MTNKDIIIRPHPKGGFEVIKGDLSSGKLLLGEMIEQILSLTLNHTPKGRFTSGKPCYRMMTPEEWKARFPGDDDGPECPCMIDDAGSGV